MYSGKLVLSLVGFDAEQIALVNALEPADPLTHEVIAIAPDEIAKLADPIPAGSIQGVFVALPDSAALSTLDAVLDAVPENTEVIAAAPTAVTEALGAYLDRLTDIWHWPMSNEQLTFHFTRWQDLKKHETDAWETNQFFESAINSTPSLVWFKTRDGVHEKVNDSFCATVNKTKEDVQGRKHAYIWDVEEDDPVCIESENQVMLTEQTLVSEEVVQTGDNEPRLLTTYKSPLYDMDGSVMGTVGLAIDITQERAYEQSLLEKNRTLEAIFTSLDCGVLTHSVDGSRIVGVNQAALRILGYESEEELIADGFNLIAPSVLDEDKPRLRDAINSLTTVGDTASIDYRAQHQDGEIIYIIGNIKLIERNGELLYQRFLLDYSDEKNRQNIEEARRRDQIRALAADYVAVCGFDLDTEEGEILRLSPTLGDSFANVFGDDMSLSKSMRSYIMQRVRTQDQKVLFDALTPKHILNELKDKDRFDVNYRVHEGNGDIYCQLTVARAGGWGGSNGHHVVIGFRNVDAQTREEMEKQHLLQDALERATRASEAKSSFLTNMSHDIRTPISAIVGFTTLSRNHIDDRDRVEGYLEKIQASSDHLLGLINDILDMSRIENGKTVIEEAPCNLCTLVDEFAQLLEPQALEHGLNLKINTENVGCDSVLCDKVKVTQVLMNLAGNAIKFTPEGGTVTITVAETENSLEDKRDFRISVADDGIGMEKDFLDHIFDPFERERTSTISGIQGTGLGMAITKSLVEMMGGTIKVESQKGVGTTFTVHLAFHTVDSSEAEGPDAHSSDATITPENLMNMRLLLVEDNLLNREIGLTLLTDAGFEVETATDGKEALDIMSGSQPDRFQAILMDVQMPVMNGYEATRAIRALPNKDVASIPILAVTADAFDEDRQKALQAGMNGHLPKPINIANLMNALETFVN